MIMKMEYKRVVGLAEEQALDKYFECNMNLTKAARELFIHRNSMQYRLKRIFKKTGLNPLVITDLLSLMGYSK